MKSYSWVVALSEKVVASLDRLWYMVHWNGRKTIARNTLFRQCEGSGRMAPEPLSANENGQYFKLPK